MPKLNLEDLNTCIEEHSAMTNELTRFLSDHQHDNIFVENFIRGNNGDVLIRMGLELTLEKMGSRLVDSPEKADLILFRGSGSMNEIHPGGIHVLHEYRQRFPDMSMAVAPSTYIFRNVDVKPVFEASQAPLTLFARDKLSIDFVHEVDPPDYVTTRLSPDTAFALKDSNFVTEQFHAVSEKHILIALRKDIEGAAGGILTKTHGRWLPANIRKPLSKLRDRLVASKSHDKIDQFLQQENIDKHMPKIYRDVSVSVSFEDFIASVRDARLIITNRMHVGILGHLMHKRVILIEGSYHKIRGVYEYSMADDPNVTLSP